MKYDPTLFAGNFSHISETGFLGATEPKPNAILLYSGMRDAPLDEQFRKLAATTAASRSVIFPADVRISRDGDYASFGSLARDVDERLNPSVDISLRSV